MTEIGSSVDYLVIDVVICLHADVEVFAFRVGLDVDATTVLAIDVADKRNDFHACSHLSKFLGQQFGVHTVSLSKLERAVRLELTNTGFAVQRLSRLATRAQ